MYVNNLISPGQSGFTNNRQTLDHIVHLEQDIRTVQAQKQHTFIDFSKAVDTYTPFTLYLVSHTPIYSAASQDKTNKTELGIHTDRDSQ